MTFPPQPSTITIPATIAGSLLQSENVSVSVTDGGFPDAVVTKTNDKLALLVTGDQQVSINTNRSDATLTVNNDVSTAPTVRMSYQNRYFYDGWISDVGDTIFNPTSTTPNVDTALSTVFRKNINVSDHDGMSTGLKLGGVVVTATATELNYVDVATGVATARKAIVLDANKSVSGLGVVNADNLGGTITTGAQPNITSLKSVNITDGLSIGGVAISVNPTKFSYLDIATTGDAYINRALVLDGDKNIKGINSLKATSLAGTLTTGPQPNITAVGTLASLSVTGATSLSSGASIATSEATPLRLLHSADPIKLSSIYTNPTGDLVLITSSGIVKIGDNNSLDVIAHDGTQGLKLGGILVTATASQINRINTSEGIAAASKALVLDSTRSITNIASITAEKVYSTIMTPAQPNIASVTTLDITGHDGTSNGLKLGGTLVTATADQLNRLSVSEGVAVASKALVTDANKNLVGLNAISSKYLVGTLLSPEQPNISSVTALQITSHDGTKGLKLGDVLVTATGAQLNSVAVTPGSAVASKALVLDAAKSITGVNDFTANNLYGLVQTPSQPNITSVSVLNIATHDGVTVGLSLNGKLVKATADQMNALATTSGTAEASKALLLNASRSITGINNLSASTLGGLISDAHQPNITSVDTLNITKHDGSQGLKLKGTLVTSTAQQLNYVAVDQGVGTASKAVVLDAFRNVININNLSAAQLTGIIQTESQPLLTRVNTLNILNHNGSTTGLSLNGVLVTATAQQLNQMNVTAGIALENRVMVVDGSRSIKQLNVVTANKFEGIVSTAAQPNITSVQTLNIAAHNGSTTGLSLNGTLVTATASELNRLDTIAGSVEAGCAVVADNNRSVQNLNSLKATTLTGTLQTSFQPNISKVETLNINGHDGGTKGLSLNGTIVTAGAQQLNYTSVVPGSATALRAMVTNEFNSITGINKLQATKLSADQFEITGVVSNFNVGSLLIKSYSFTDLIGRMIDIQTIPSLNFSNFQPANQTDGYSCEIIGYILPRYAETYTFYVSCNDRVRLWVNGELLLHSWTKIVGTRTSTKNIFLNAEQWVPIYIQYQVDTGSIPTFLLEWMSISTTRGQIISSRLAWDNNPPARAHKPSFDSQLTIFNASTAAENSTVFKVDNSGDLTIDASGNDIYLGSGDSFDIPAHDGKTIGLRLAGVLVQPTAYELNYLKVSPGVVSESHALVVDSSKSIAGINSLTATTIACQNLATSAFTINNLSLTGPLNNYNSGGLLCRQITGTNFQGRVVNVGVLADISLNSYDPKEINANFSVDIIGYVMPAYTEPYRFYALTNDKIRIWVDNTLVLNNWVAGSYLEYTSDQIYLTAGRWTSIYIQFQNKDSASKLLVRWSSTSLAKTMFGSSALAWDSTITRPIGVTHAADRLTVFSSKDDLTTSQRGHVTVDELGSLQLSSTGQSIAVATGNSFNVAGHNGTTGLKLAGNLVTASAFELNYLSGVTPGSVLASKAIILNDSRTLTGFASISSTELVGTLTTPAQPNITSLGALSSELKCLSSVRVVNGASDTNALKISTDSSTSFIQTNDESDIFIGNIDKSIGESTRKFIIKSSGNIGVQTSAPARPLTINDNGQDSCMRLIRDNSNGTETTFSDVGVGSDGALEIKSNIRVGNAAIADISVNDSGVLQVSSQSGVVKIGTAINSELPLELGTKTYSIDSRVGYINAEGSVGTVVPSSSSYSMRTDGSIIVNGTVCVTSDRRLKTDIKELDPETCRRFVLGSNPVSFKYRTNSSDTDSSPSDTTDRIANGSSNATSSSETNEHGDSKQHYGLIAQEVAKSEFCDIVNIAPYAGLSSETDTDGFVSPADAAMNVSYESIIPMLMVTLKETLYENELLKQRMAGLEARLSALETPSKVKIEEIKTNI